METPSNHPHARIPVETVDRTQQRFAHYFRELFMNGVLSKESRPDEQIDLGEQYHGENYEHVRLFYEAEKGNLENIAAELPLDDPQKFVVEMTRKLQLIQISEQSDFAERLTNIRKTLASGSMTGLAALSILAFAYYTDHVTTQQ